MGGVSSALSSTRYVGFLCRDVYNTDPAQYLITAGWDLDDLSVDQLYVDQLSDLPKVW